MHTRRKKRRLTFRFHPLKIFKRMKANQIREPKKFKARM
jgi:hypothetical protein